MKSPSDFKKIFIHKDPVDMRKAIGGLSEIVQLAEMGNLMESHLFVFTGKRRNTIKILYFDKSGFALWMKRLEQDKFPWPKKLPESVVTVTPEQLSWLLDGYDIWKMRPFAELNFQRVV
ncbi:MAG: IS66 family insertion sequence element accessory protein TnpB [Pseudobdellovibrionaceae bacterium]